VLALAMLAWTTAFHYEALRVLLRRVLGHRISRPRVVGLLAALVTIHFAEVGLYAGAYALGVNVLALGRLQGSTDGAMLDFCYFAAETYSTLGYGDLMPTGAVRLLASVEALNGVLLLALSGAFLSGVLREGFRGERD
jgi:Ion channel